MAGSQCNRNAPKYWPCEAKKGRRLHSGKALFGGQGHEGLGLLDAFNHADAGAEEIAQALLRIPAQSTRRRRRGRWQPQHSGLRRASQWTPPPRPTCRGRSPSRSRRSCHIPSSPRLGTATTCTMSSLMRRRNRRRTVPSLTPTARAILALDATPVRLQNADYLEVEFIHYLVVSARKPSAFTGCRSA